MSKPFVFTLNRSPNLHPLPRKFLGKIMIEQLGSQVDKEVSHRQNAADWAPGEDKSGMAAKQIELSIEVPICAWCRRKGDPCSSDIEVSHGICPRHQKKLIAELRHGSLPPVYKSNTRSARNNERTGEPLLPLHY